MGICIMLQTAAQEPAPAAINKDYQPILDNFFSFLAKGNLSDATDALVAANPLSTSKTTDGLFNSLELAHKSAGDFVNFSPYLTKTLGDSIVYIYGFANYTNMPVRFEFIFYRVKEKWTVQNFALYINPIDEIRSNAGITIAVPKKDAN